MSNYGGGFGVKEPGFDAVRARFGEEMVQRMLNWPQLARVYCEAQNGDEDMIATEVGKVRKDLGKARFDKTFALDQAERIAGRVPRNEWGRIPTVESLRVEWGLDKPIGTVRLHGDPAGATVRPLKSVQPELSEG